MSEEWLEVNNKDIQSFLNLRVGKPIHMHQLLERSDPVAVEEIHKLRLTISMPFTLLKLIL